MKHIFSLIVCLIIFQNNFSQQHFGPIAGQPGTPGTVPGSFVIDWEEVADAIAYEYVLTNNELCFLDCPGDTRNEVVSHSEAVEYALQDSTYYFWITRILYENGDTSDWTLPSYFFAVAPDFSEPVLIAASTAPNTLRIRLDWAALQGAESLSFEIFDSQGRKVQQSGKPYAAAE
ncbi:MAG: hypothetical protein R3B47_18930 [Bacteroidia bacterium]